MKVANVVEEGKLGGPQVRMTRVAAGLQGRIETVIFMPNANSEPFQQLCAECRIPFRGVPLTRMTKEWRIALRYMVFSVSEIIRLAWGLRREKVDLVHASGGSWQIKAVLAARLAGVPAVWHLNDTCMPGWVLRLFRVVQPFASGFIHTSESVLAYYGPYISGRRPCAVIPPPVNLGEFEPGKASVAGDQSVATWRDRLVIGTVCNVNPIKGLETLIRAGGILSAEGRSIQIVVAGPIFERQRPYYRRLLGLASEVGLESIEFVGGLSDVRPFLMKVDVFVCSSVSESWCMSLWEAMAMARPVVSTDVGDVSRYIIDGESGFVVPVDDAEAMAARVGTLLDSEDHRKRCGSRAREVAMEACSIDKVADATRAFYEEVYDYSHRSERAARRVRRESE